MNSPVKPFLCDLLRRFLHNFLRNFLYSFSQIMLQRSAVTGVLFIVGIGVNSPIMLFGAAIAVLSTLMVAHFFQYDTNTVNSGLYGFNAALAGMAVFFFLPINGVSFTLAIFSGVISTIIMHIMLQVTSHKWANFPVLTAPFIMSTWLILLLINLLGVDITPMTFGEHMSSGFYTVLRGIGQIMFQGYWLSGITFVVGLFLHSYKVAIWTIVGSAAGLLIAYICHFPEELAQQGLYSFNASLTAIALADRFDKQKWPIFMGILVSVLLTRAFEYTSIPALTAPFVLASWIVIALVKIDPNITKVYSLHN